MAKPKFKELSLQEQWTLGNSQWTRENRLHEWFDLSEIKGFGSYWILKFLKRFQIILSYFSDFTDIVIVLFSDCLDASTDIPEWGFKTKKVKQNKGIYNLWKTKQEL